MRKLLLVTTALLALSGAASANPVTLNSIDTLDTAGVQGFNVFSGSLGVNYGNYAGPIELHTNGGDFLAYCMDLLHFLTPTTQYNLVPFTDSGSGLLPSQVHQMEVAANLGFAAYNNQTEGWQLYAEAAQLAIWKIEYGGALNVTINAGGDHDIELGDYNAILLAATGMGGDTGVMELMPVTGNTQAMLVQTSAVPGPVVGAGLPGLITACVSLWGFARNRKRRAVA